MVKGWLTPKQEAFCLAYLETGNASEAYRHVYGEHVGIGDEYYVYALVAEDIGEIIYIGKGKGQRMFNHVADAKNGRIYNAPKHKAITDIIARGSSVVEMVIESGLDEKHALRFEKYLITQFKNSLTNIASGSQHNHDKVGQLAEYYLTKTKPFDVWVRTMPDRMWFEVCKQDLTIARKWYDDHANTLRSILDKVRNGKPCLN